MEPEAREEIHSVEGTSNPIPPNTERHTTSESNLTEDGSKGLFQNDEDVYVCDPSDSSGKEKKKNKNKNRSLDDFSETDLRTKESSLPSFMVALRTSAKNLITKAKEMPKKHLIFVIVLVTTVMVGNFLQILMLNFWLHSFPGETPGNYTTFAVPSFLLCLTFVISFAVFAITKRPDLRFARHKYGWALIFGIGAMDMLNSWMASYAATYTSEVLQALFTNLCPLYAVFFCKYFLKDTRKYWNPYIIGVFVLTILGVLAASLYGLIKNSAHMGDGKWWILVFFASMPLRVLMNVWQTVYMILYTRDDMFVQWLRDRFDRQELNSGEETGEGERERLGGGGMNESDRKLRAESPGIPEDTVEKPREGTVEGSVLDDGISTSPRPQRSRLQRNHEIESHHSFSSSDLDNIDTENLSAPLRQSGDADSVLSGPTLVLPPRGRLTPLPGSINNSLYQSFASATRERAYASNYSSMHPSPVLRPPIAPEIMIEPLTESEMPSNEGRESPAVEVSSAAPEVGGEELVSIRYHQGDDTAVKLFMLATETSVQMLLTISMLPADALPWWGNSESVHETWDNFAEGITCVFTIPKNFLFGFLYTMGFVFTYFGSAYLNHYSVALCSIVTQLSSPMTAFILVLVPSWNVAMDGSDSPWWCSIIAIVLLTIAAFLYVFWEERTDEEKIESERVLKMEKLKVKPIRKNTVAEVTP